MNLNNLSQKLKIDLVYFLPRGLWVSLRFFVVTLITLMISVVFARLVSKEIFGQYQYVLSVAALLSIFSLPGLNTAALRAYLKGDRRAVAYSVRYSFASSWLAAIILIFWGMTNFAKSDHTLGLALMSAGILLPFFYAPNNWYIYYEGELNFRSSTLRIIFANLVLLVGLIVGLQVKLNLIGLILIYFGLNGLLNYLFFWEGRRKLRPQPSVPKLNLQYALKCSFQKFSFTLGESIQAVAISGIFGFANLAIYQVAQSFVNAFSGLTGALGSIYFPLLLKYKRLNHGLIIIEHLLLGLGFWAVYLAAVKLLFTPLYGEKYEEAIVLGYKLSFIVMLIPLRIYLVNFFTARDDNRFIITSNIAAILIALLIFYLIRGSGFGNAAVIYLYSLNILTSAPLFVKYLFVSFRRSGAILNSSRFDER